MLVLKRKEGQWVEVVHRSGDVLRLRVYGISAGVPGRVNIAFDDRPRHFEIRRPERRLPGTPAEPTHPCEQAAEMANATEFPANGQDITPLDTTMPIVTAE